jgi:hypothetical protein
MSYVWWVIVNCRRVGYVESPSQIGALRKAKEKFGDLAWIERYSDGKSVVSNQSGLAGLAVVSEKEKSRSWG